MQRLGRLGLANETEVIDLTAAAPAVQRRAVTRTATHAATPRAAWQRRCSPERWTDHSSPTSTVFPTDSADAPRDSWRDEGRSRPRIGAAATFAATRRPSTEREGTVMAEIAGTDASRALLINDRANLSRERVDCDVDHTQPTESTVRGHRHFAHRQRRGCRAAQCGWFAINSWRASTGALCGYAPVASKHRDAPSFRAATRVVSNRTAPQHHSTSAGLWFQSHGFQTRGYRPAEFLWQGELRFSMAVAR